MKNLFLLLILCFSAGEMIPEKPEPINAVIGDISYIKKFKTSPSLQTPDQERIKTHLEYVESELRQKSVSHLSREQKENRTQLLDYLKTYTKKGIFPKNTYTKDRNPIFLDAGDRVCAVGYLVQQSAGQKLVEKINTTYQLASIYDMKMPELNSWVGQSGFSIDELAMIQPAYGGGIILPPPNPRRPRPIAGLFPFELESLKVETSITGQSATTTMEQVFYNPTHNQQQGFYYFPVPEKTSIGAFTMHINGKETPGELLDSKKAKKIYEDIVRRHQDPALLEFYNKNLLKVRVFPVAPRSTCKIKLSYTQTLTKESGTIEYVFPMKVNNERSKPIKDFSIQVALFSPEKIKTLYVPTHEAEIIRKTDKKAVISMEGKNIKSTSDFKLYYNTASEKVGASVLSYNDGREDGYFFLNVSPGWDQQQEIAEKDITFVLDASGSMAGEKMEQAQKALQFCINNLNKGDYFNIIRFSTEANGLFSELKLANKENLEMAEDYIDDLRAIGGTNIDEALEMALQTKSRAGRPHFIVFMTDGKPTIGETKPEALLGKVSKINTENTRIFTFGIGTNLNIHLLDQLTEKTNAYRTYVLPDEDIEIKVSDFFTKVSSPVLSNIQIKIHGVKYSDIYPKKPGDLFRGSTLNLLGRYKGHGPGKVVVEGEVNGKKERFIYEINFNKKDKEYDFIPPLWATRVVGYLLDQIRLHGETKEVREEIVRLAKQHGIITPYTSYLILEDEESLVRNNIIRPEDQILRNRINHPNTGFSMEKNKMDYIELQEDTGMESVVASEAVQKSRDKATVDNIRQSNETMNYKDVAGNQQSLASGIQNIQGRAMYNHANQWLDVDIQNNNTLNINKIKFNSDAYFKLVREEPESIPFLALGKNVRFVLNNQIYDIHE